MLHSAVLLPLPSPIEERSCSQSSEYTYRSRMKNAVQRNNPQLETHTSRGRNSRGCGEGTVLFLNMLKSLAKQKLQDDLTNYVNNAMEDRELRVGGETINIYLKIKTTT